MDLRELLPYLPATNAFLNSSSAVLLTAGYVFIKKKAIYRHRACMIAAVITSTAFLTSYLTYHFGMEHYYHRGATKFVDPAWFRPIYLAILITHTLLAVVIVPLVILSLIWGLKRKDEKHRRISKWTWPLWMYVSVTGVVIYLLLYQIFPQAK
jgi:uncharacterized membrane protein YozB (DUF420 family)